MREYWKPLKGYEGVYWISGTGRIRNAKRKILQPIGSSQNFVELHKNGQRETKLIYTLVIENFGGTYEKAEK